MRRYIALVLLALGACTPDYPFDKEGTWSLGPQGAPNANDANLRAMLVNPNDLVAGHGDPGSVGAVASRPVKNLIAGKRAPLPVVSAETSVDQQQQQQQQPQAAAQ